jgi:hypothetical protein
MPGVRRRLRKSAFMVDLECVRKGFSLPLRRCLGLHVAVAVGSMAAPNSESRAFPRRQYADRIRSLCLAPVAPASRALTGAASGAGIITTRFTLTLDPGRDPSVCARL